MVGLAGAHAPEMTKLTDFHSLLQQKFFQSTIIANCIVTFVIFCCFM